MRYIKVAFLLNCFNQGSFKVKFNHHYLFGGKNGLFYSFIPFNSF
jgi:hypothetical protein